MPTPAPPAELDNLRRYHELMENEDAIRRNKVLALLADRAVWGWACFTNREFRSRLCTTPEAAIADREASGLAFESGLRYSSRPLSVLVVRSLVGKPLVIEITEAELADLGLCPNL